MLPPAHRMRRSADFGRVVRSGRKARRGAVVAHQRLSEHTGPALVGFVVGRSVGGSVQRHLVTRRLRHVVRLSLEQFPAGSATVIRALPESATRSSAELGSDVAGALQRLAKPR